MAFIEKERFEGTVQGAAFVPSPEGGKSTGGFSLIVTTSEGPIDRTWWVSENSVSFLKENLHKVFGITDEQLDDESFLEGGVGAFLRGKPCAVVPELATDSNGNLWKDKNGNTRWTIQWLNPSRLGRSISGSSTKKLRSLFGGGRSSGGTGEQEPPPADWAETDSPD